ncbi:AbrB/MazE/SpoVT family DNA-binding domain-containing protein [Natroniella acetigena]|uniref:AbrB/MazE/SpoVT family DNA-binding domain-containing protein n=1 Tax=Natroniella acetigena TaxID=52004 RepID=UPI00200A7B17|nr:AbrB/MazE/SpoVT family DNA-binding domain-containing protein [Natroniella acetigena]MCK8828146.1 AbrB/MazE/SpoVT family DNA-binding domain-containing protein [Natroniella acetigena]
MNFKPVIHQSSIDSVGKTYIPSAVRKAVRAQEGDKVEVLADKSQRAILIKVKEEGGS